jgi:hypothetical protein
MANPTRGDEAMRRADAGLALHNGFGSFRLAGFLDWQLRIETNHSIRML